MDRSLTIAGVVAAGLVTLGVVSWPSAPEPVPVRVVAADSHRMVTIHVSGAVALPGLVEVSASARIADAIVAAGGALPDADLAALNLAASVGDGARIVVPTGSGSGVATAGDGLVRLNTSTVAELEELSGVGPVLAQRIVAHRDAHGPFSEIEDLLDVPGIGESKLAAIRDEAVVP